jgi:copper chaperone CopZ
MEIIMKTETLRIDGMTCGHCVMHVKKELSRLPNLQVDDVQIGTAQVQYDAAKVSIVDLAQAVERAGYKLIS